MKKIALIILAVLMLSSLCLPAAAEEAGHNHKYRFDYIVRSEDGSRVESFGIFCEDCDEVIHIKTGAEVINYSISQNGWGTGGKTTWFFIDGLVSLKDPVRIYGTVNLVLLDKALLICESGIHVFDNGTLNIYSEHLDYSPAGEENTMGSIRSYAKDATGTASAIGGLQNEKNVTVNIFGGDIYAYSDGDGAAIGSGKGGAAVVNIYGGKVRAESVGLGAGIGGGYDYSDVELNFYGGIVQASNADRYAFSIGKGFWECHAKVGFFGGYVYGKPRTVYSLYEAGITADSIESAKEAKKIGNTDGIYDSEGLALARQAGWIDDSGYPVGSVVGAGNWRIAAAVGAAAVIAAAVLVIVKKKKKAAGIKEDE